ncbi:fimbrial protein [Buttiauxella sp. S04-F03]|uniref:fimbrial protein n=1 Tax=Buttiauxella sp. S04-F03 TaxID=2904525 RepID=UPI001E30ECB4|nr:fimbrial protein [Buttiauxella sp. S04-F03]MCE0813793.1 type 1 fimbrial protein [Buttiauxella sp. S04-F03]
MKLKTVISVGTVLALNLVSLPYAAAVNTITFNGHITDATCDVTLQYKGAEAGSEGTGSIDVGEVSASALIDPNSSAGQEPFHILAKNCSLGTSAKTKIAANFKSANGDNQGYLNNIAIASAATNVQFRLRDSASKIIKVNDPNQVTNTATTTINTDVGGITDMLYYVEFVSTAGSATQGNVTSTVDYELMYQ